MNSLSPSKIPDFKSNTIQKRVKGATYEHGRSQVELVEELRDEDVHLKHVRHVLAFNVTQDVDEPLEVTVRRADPEEVDLLTSHAGISEMI